MAFNSNSGKQDFSATAAQTNFDFNFKIYEDTDVKVYLTPVGQEPNDANDILTLASEYTVSINGDLGGTVTLLSGATLNDTVVVKRELPVTRTTSYVTQGDLIANTINIDQNYQTYLIIDNVVDLTAALRLPDTAVGVSTQLPAVEALAYLRWNSAGDAIENDTTIPQALIDAIAAAAAAEASEIAAAASEAASAASADDAQLKAWEAEAAKLTATSYATEAEDVPVNIVTSDGDGTFTYTPTSPAQYSALHWAAKTPDAPTDVPILTGNSSGTETTDLIVTITNWNSDQTLTISVEAGSYVDNADGTITWTLPAFTGVDDSHNMSVQATEPSHTISEIVTHTVAVTELTSTPDQTILYENATIDATNFPTTTNINLTGNTILATADTASATSSVVSQDGGDTDFVNATPTVDNTIVNYTVSAGATTTSVTITGATTFVTGDILLMNKAGTTVLSEIDTTSITTDNGGDSYTFDLTGLGFTSAPLIVAKDTANVSTSIVATGASDSFVARAIQSHTSDEIGGTILNDAYETVLGTATPSFLYDIAWTKDRNNATACVLSDTITGDFYLTTNSANAKTATVPTVDSDDVTWGFNLPTDNPSNTNGTITSVTKKSSFCNLVSFVGSGSITTVGHDLGAAPELMINKGTSFASNYNIYSKSTTSAAYYLRLNSTAAEDNVQDFWNSTAPTATIFSLSAEGDVNASGEDFITLCFISVPGICKVGEVNIAGGVMSGDTDLGFPLGFGLFIPVDIVGDREIINSETTNFLEANTPDTEITNGADRVTVTGDIISNNGLPNGKYIVLAITKEIDKTPTKITDLFDTDTRIGRDIKHKVELADSGDEVTRISTPVEKLT